MTLYSALKLEVKITMHSQNLIVSLCAGLFFGLSFGATIFPIWGQDSKIEIRETGSDTHSLITSSQLDVSVTVDSRGSILRFDWGKKKPALAVVKESISLNEGKWWIVFDESAIPNLPNLKEHPITGLKSIQIIPVKDAVVLHITTDSQFMPDIEKEGDQWQIIFKSQPIAPRHEVSLQYPQSKEDGFVVDLENSGKEVRFIDSATGYVNVIFPTARVGLGREKNQTFPEFHLLSTAQGIGFQLVKEDMVLQVSSPKIKLSHPDGLAISTQQDRDRVRPGVESIGFFTDAQDLDWVARCQKINEELLDLPHTQHGPGELEIAWLLLSYGRTEEAMGYLAHLAQERPSITDLPLFHMLHGMGNLLLNRLSEAQMHLWSLQTEPEVQVWLATVNALQHSHNIAINSKRLQELRAQFQEAKIMMKTYPKPLREQYVSVILMAGIAVQDLETLKAFLEQETSPENSNQREVYELARARVLMSQMKPEAAMQILGELMEKATSTLVRAIACFDYVCHRLETKLIKPEDALSQLEAIRLQWHGGWLDRQIEAYLVKWRAQKK